MKTISRMIQESYHLLYQISALVSELQLLIIKISVIVGVVKFEFDSYIFKILTCMGRFQVLIPSKYGDHLREGG